MTRFGFPLPARCFLWPGLFCSRLKPAIFNLLYLHWGKSIFLSHLSYTSPLLLPNRFWWFLTSSIKGTFSTSVHISEGSSATDTRQDHLQLPIAAVNCLIVMVTTQGVPLTFAGLRKSPRGIRARWHGFGTSFVLVWDKSKRWQKVQQAKKKTRWLRADRCAFEEIGIWNTWKGDSKCLYWVDMKARCLKGPVKTSASIVRMQCNFNGFRL